MKKVCLIPVLMIVILGMASCLMPSSHRETYESPSAMKVLIPAAASASSHYDQDRGVVMASSGMTTASFPVYLHEGDCLISFQSREIPGETSRLELIGQEEGHRFVVSSSNQASGSTWERIFVKLDPPHELIDETAYIIAWSSYGGEIEQVQIIYEPGGCITP